MITPLDIQNKEFAKAVRGYKEEEVDGFLDLLTLDLEKLMDENQKLKDQIKVLNSELTRYKSTEGTVLETLEAAKALMGDISASAEKRAEILVKNAELDAQLIQREAKESVERLTEESASLRNRFNLFCTKYRSLLETELERFDTLSAELFDDKEFADLQSMVEEIAKPIESSRGREREEQNLNQGAEGKTIVNLRRGDRS